MSHDNEHTRMHTFESVVDVLPQPGVDAEGVGRLWDGVLPQPAPAAERVEVLTWVHWAVDLPEDGARWGSERGERQWQSEGKKETERDKERDS